MHYSIKISSEPKFKFSDTSGAIVTEEHEESKSDSSDASSLVTEEDISGNPLPPEIIKIRVKNKQLQKDLTNTMMNYKSSNRSILQSPNKSYEEPNSKISVVSSKDIIKSISSNQALKNFLDQIVKLQVDYENAKKELQEKEEEIFNVDSEYSDLKVDLKNFEDGLKNIATSRSINNGCSCIII
jgi:chromosome segregation ATPase